jgi:mono/diheme cytochrome c family protein
MKTPLSKFAKSFSGQLGSAFLRAFVAPGFSPAGATVAPTFRSARAGLKPGATRALLLAVILFTGLATSCRQNRAAVAPDPLARAYDSEADWNDASKVIPLNYQQAQGKRVFYQYCVWCHADSTPAGPSNRSNLTPNPPLANDGATLNTASDDFLRNVITLGGAAAGKSASMPPWGKTLSQDDIDAVISFYRAIAQPPYQAPARPGPKYSVR